jgi:hypothetical protein
MQQRVTDFDSDKAWTEQARGSFERDLYPALAWEGRFVYLARSAGSEFLQRVAHIDAVVQTGPGVSITVEEKIVRRKYAALAVETHSRVESGERDGWIYTSTADTLIYAFGVQGGLECWIMSLPALRQWFEPRESGVRRTAGGERARWQGLVSHAVQAGAYPGHSNTENAAAAVVG